MDPRRRSFLFLQGPHGPFFAELAEALGDAGARTLRAGFNRGDEAEWHDPASYVPFRGPPEAWPDFLAGLVARERVTDLVLYGDARPVHREARAEARRSGLTVHCFEEGYLRPWWVTYERGGTNGHSRLMSLSIAQMRRAVEGLPQDLPEAPARWGAVFAHAWAGAAYHARILARNGDYPEWRPHRGTDVRHELLLHLRRLALRPLLALQSRIRERRLARSGTPYHLVLLQLAHDSSMLHHSRFRSVAAFMEHVIDGFVEGAPRHHRLVFKAHPFEDGREPIERIARGLARDLGIARRVTVIHGGKLGRLLDRARTAVTVNSTAAQQALWRGLPVSIHGAAVYDKPELVSRQPLAEFFRDPVPPDMAAYRDFRRFLLATSQVRGGFYTAEGRASAIRVLVDSMLDARDPYDRLFLRPELLGDAGPKVTPIGRGRRRPSAA